MATDLMKIFEDGPAVRFEVWKTPPSLVNDVCRLFFGVREDFGPEVLDNAESFDKVFGAGSFAKADCRVLDMVRCLIEDAPDHVIRFNSGKVKQVEQKRPDGE